MLGALAMVVCLVAGGGVGFILFHLYGPKVSRRPAVRSVPARMILEPMFGASPRPASPRGRMARGTGGVPNKVPSRGETTEKVVARYP
jgi:hypothetical protein